MPNIYHVTVVTELYNNMYNIPNDTKSAVRNTKKNIRCHMENLTQK